MASDRKLSLTLPIAGATLLLGLYFVAYFGTVCPAWESGKPYDVAWDLGPVTNPPFYFLPGGREFDGWLFIPIHWFDRKVLRSRTWEPEPESGPLWQPLD